jgi:hypothetical protein
MVQSFGNILYEVRLYKAHNFPYEWQYHSTLVSVRDLRDATVFHHNNLWWMFAAGSEARDCELYYSNNLTTGWVEHPKSPIVTNDTSKARPGGRSFVFDNNRVIRIAMDNGKQVRAFEVDILTEEDYAEHEIPESPILGPSGIGWNKTGMHQFDPWWNGNHWLCAVDGKSGDNNTWSIGLYIAPHPSYPNQSPISNAGPNQTVEEGLTVTLDGSNSADMDGSISSYLWTQTEGIPVTLSDPTAAKPTFVTPIVSPGGMTLTFELVVKDNEDLQDTSEVSITVNDNGISGFPDDVLTMTCSTGKHIGLKVESGGNLVSLFAVDPETLEDFSPDKPEDLPYGLIDMLIKTDAVGSTVKLTFYLESPAGKNDKWFEYKISTGSWEDCSAYASFNAARDQVTLTLVDGGDGDDGYADGWVVDPSGLGSTSTTTTSSGGGGGGGCFIATAGDS